jgi:hypothetical protein
VSASPPSLYRLSRLLRRLAVVALVAILVYVGADAYTGSQIRVQTQGNQVSGALVGNTATVTALVNITNGGWLSVNDLSLTTLVRFPNGTLLGIAHSGSTSVAAGARVSVPVSLSISLNGSTAGLSVLLTQSLKLPAETWANATFGGIVSVHVADNASVSWGAPFDGLSVSYGTPVAQSNGTVRLPVTIAFTDRSPFADNGTIDYTVRSAGSQLCASGTLTVAEPSGGAYNMTVPVYAAAGCNPSGGSLTLKYAASGLKATLGRWPIP